MTKIMVTALLAATLGGCATSQPPRPNVGAYPARGQSAEQQARDSYECQAWARQQTAYDPAADTAKSAGVGLAVGAIAGAATGAAIGAATGNAGRGAAVGAVVGGVGGTAVGAGYGYTRNREGYDRAYAACMLGRGYSVAR